MAARLLIDVEQKVEKYSHQLHIRNSSVNRLGPIVRPSTFSRDKRILKRRDFLRVQRFGVRAFGRFVVAVGQRDKDNSQGKIGITVPKKVGKAHVRNMIKRRIRHVMRTNQDLFFERILVIVVRESANAASFFDLEADLKEACARLRHSKVNRRTYAIHKQ